ncbi:LysR substrate-binding domain-containing protein, partial [Acinetobacter baumannii]
AQARQILREAEKIQMLINEEKNITTGEIKLGIIPTLAPYLLPGLFKQVREKYPHLNMVIKETITEEIIQELKQNKLDCGLV